MTWESQDPAAPQDPQAAGAEQPPSGYATSPEGQQPLPPEGQQPPPPPPGYAPPPDGQQQAPPPYAPPPEGQQPPPPYAPPPGQQPPPGYAPPPEGQQPPPPYAPPPGQQPPPYAPPPGYAPPPEGQQPPPPGYAPPPPGDAWAQQPPPDPMWQPPPAYPLAPDAYPVNVSFDREARINRLWGIPLIGQFIRWILLIPHYLLMLILILIAAIQLLVTWIPVLVLGRFPSWGYRWIGGLLGYSQRVQAYAMLMTSTYPPFSLSGEDYPISVRFDEGVRINRLWGIPLLGMLVRVVLLIPHIIILFALGILVGILAWFVWIPVLILGRQADLIYTMIGGFYRWQLRIAAYALLMVDRYPPFSLGEDDPRL